jgi:hypothetical protein
VVGAASLALVVTAAAWAGSASVVDLPTTFRTHLPKVKRASTVPVYLPTKLPLAGPAMKLYPTSAGSKNAWDLELSYAAGCGGATACFGASFEGRRGGKLPFRSNLRLAGGQPAHYRPISCGASCAPANLWFVHRGVLYQYQVKQPLRDTKAALAALANQALAAGPR